MAILKSLAVGKARKSAGNITYRNVRGRTIISERVTSRAATRAPSAAQTERTAYFAAISRFARIYGASITASFTPTRYGTGRNAFMKKNYTALKTAFEAHVSTPEEVAALTDAEIDQIVTDFATANPTSILRIDVQGKERIYLNAAWGSIEDPAGGSVAPPVEPPVSGVFGVASASADGVTVSIGAASPGVDRQDLLGKTLLIKGSGLSSIDAKQYDLADGSRSRGLSVDNATNTQAELSGFYVDVTGGADEGVYGFEITAGGETKKYFFK